MIPYGHGISGYILSFLSVIVALVTDFLSLTVILIILYHLHHHRRQLKREEKITLVLSSHIYLYILMSTTVLSLMNIQSLIGDIYGNNFNSPWCVFQGYWFLASAGMIYYGFAVQVIRFPNSSHPSTVEKNTTSNTIAFLICRRFFVFSESSIQIIRDFSLIGFLSPVHLLCLYK